MAGLVTRLLHTCLLYTSQHLFGALDEVGTGGFVGLGVYLRQHFVKFFIIILCVVPVSYTHLETAEATVFTDGIPFLQRLASASEVEVDVYKRQHCGGGAVHRLRGVVAHQ